MRFPTPTRLFSATLVLLLLGASDRTSGQTIPAGLFTIEAPKLGYVGQTFQITYTPSQIVQGENGPTNLAVILRKTDGSNVLKNSQATAVVFQSNFAPTYTAGPKTLTYSLSDSLVSADNYVVTIGNDIAADQSNQFRVLTTDEANKDPTIMAVISTLSGYDKSFTYRSPTDTLAVTWKIQAGGGKPLQVDLLFANNNTVARSINTVLPSALKYSWVLPNDVPTEQYALRVGYPPDGVLRVTSSVSILFYPYGDLTRNAKVGSIIQPQPMTFGLGDTVFIRWTNSEEGGRRYTVDLVKSISKTVVLQRTIATDVSPEAQHYEWVIPSDVPLGDYAIRMGYPAEGSVQYSPTFSVGASMGVAASGSGSGVGMDSGSGSDGSGSTLTGTSQQAQSAYGSGAGHIVASLGGGVATACSVGVVTLLVVGARGYLIH